MSGTRAIYNISRCESARRPYALVVTDQLDAYRHITKEQMPIS